MTIRATQGFHGGFATSGRREAVHDLRNLFAVVAAAKHLLERAPERVPLSELLAAIGDAANRGGRLTTRLLAETAAPQASSPTDVGARLADLAPMMNALAGSKLELDLQLGGPQAFVDPVEFDSAILELIANARKAEAHTIVVRSRIVGSRLWILVCDDGRGMMATTLARARLGRDAGAAHGAGLAGVHRFARASFGKLRIRSHPFAGTSVALILPTVLSLAVDECRAPQRNVSRSVQKIHVQDRQPVPA